MTTLPQEMIMKELTKERQMLLNVIDNQNNLIEILKNLTDRLEDEIEQKEAVLLVTASLLIGLRGNDALEFDDFLNLCNEIINVIVGHFSGMPIPDELVDEIENGKNIISDIIEGKVHEMTNVTFTFRDDGMH